ALTAIARISARVFDRKLHGRHQIIPADFLRNDLIDRVSGTHVRACSLLGFISTQKRRSYPVIGACRAWGRFCGSRMQAAQDRDVITVWLERFEDERIIEAGPDLVGHPVAGRHAVAHEATEKSRFWISCRLRQSCRGRHHCLEKWQSE